MIGDLNVEIPDLAEPITGCRAFQIGGDKETPILMSMNNAMWPPNGTGKRPYHEVDYMTATCNALESVAAVDHVCPCPVEEAVWHTGMGCGIYAYKTIPDMAWDFPLWSMERFNPHSGIGLQVCTIWGDVELWGHVYDHEKGYRAEHGRIKCLYHVKGFGHPLNFIEKIAEFYGVPVVEVELDYATIRAEHSERRSGLTMVDPMDLVLMILGSMVKTAVSEFTNNLREWRKNLGRNRRTREDAASGGSSSGSE